MNRWHLLMIAVATFLLFLVPVVTAPDPSSAKERPEMDDCVACHFGVTRGIVTQWLASEHAAAGHSCGACHGQGHHGVDDVAKAKMPTPKVCGTCHAEQTERFALGKHAKAWAAAQALPVLGRQPGPVVGDGCLSCHDIGRPNQDGSVGRCDSCHTRHVFSKAEARRPETCRTCHTGEEHSQYEMWETSRHGILDKLDPGSGRAPVCQTCHMDLGDHNVRTSWGYLAMRFPAEDRQWNAAQLKILRAMGPEPKDEAGMKKRLEKAARLDLMRMDEKSFEDCRRDMKANCRLCHSERFVEERFVAMDKVIRESTLLMAGAVEIVERLYEDGVLPGDDRSTGRLDILQLYESPTPIEQELYRMLLFLRQRVYQGVVHSNPDYAHWKGWGPMKASLVKIKAMAKEMRRRD